jgi:hypothetical protein
LGERLKVGKDAIGKESNVGRSRSDLATVPLYASGRDGLA